VSVAVDYLTTLSAAAATMEFYPPKALNGYNGTQIPSQFLVDTLNANLFPFLILLPDGRVFMAANT
jgi:hypothetical protein